MKTILITVIVQAVMTASPEPGKPPPAMVLEVKSHAMQEFDSKEACINAARGLTLLGASGDVFQVLWGCAPKDIAKLEVETPKPKARPQLETPRIDAHRGSRS